jgi:hypothetical protein
MSVDEAIKEHRLQYTQHWRTRSDWYWYWRALQEFIELGLSLLGWHKGPPALEKTQIAGIMANWLDYRDETPHLRPLGGDE